MITTSAFAMGLLAVSIAYLVSRFSKTNETLALILGGMVVSSLFSAGTSFVKLVADTDSQLPAITYWLMGMLTSIKVKDLKFIIFPIAIGSMILLCIRWRLNLLTVEEDTAKSVGINVTALRLVVIVCATLLTAASVSVSGMIGWVGLVIPHFCRMLFGYDYRRLVPATMLMGGAFLVFVDDVARYITTEELPLGILTSFIGAPLFIYLILTGGGKKSA
jgi:iron complex transport system permease protein